MLSLFDAAINNIDLPDLRVIFNERISSIYSRFANILNNSENKFSVLKKNTTNDSSKMKIASKILGKIGELLQDSRELNSFKIKKTIWVQLHDITGRV